MKKAFLITVLAALGAIGAYAQGTVSFSAGVGKIKYSIFGATNYPVPVGNPDSLGVTITFYSAPSGTVLGQTTFAFDGFYLGIPDFSTGGWAEATTLVHNIAPLAGAVPTSTVTLAASTGAPGATEELEMVAWTGNYSDFATAFAHGADIAWTGPTSSSGSGGAFGWSQATGTFDSPAVATVGSDGYPGTLILGGIPIPEPGSIALSALGAATLLFFRRRK